jgi:hypothetical protein
MPANEAASTREASLVAENSCPLLILTTGTFIYFRLTLTGKFVILAYAGKLAGAMLVELEKST